MPCVEEQTRLSIKNILLATGYSEPSEAILSYSASLARRYGSRISLAGTVSPEVICEIIRNRQVDLVVIGARAQKLRKFTLDSKVEDIVRTAPCPVLIIGPEVTHTELAKGALERIVYMTDFSISSLEALPYAVALAQDNEAQLTFVHVAEETTMGPFHFGNSRSVAFRKRLESMVASRSSLPSESEFVVAEGDRAEGLVRVAATVNASLIVVSARVTPGEAFAQLRPIGSQVICRARCPVLTVRG